MSLHTRPVNIQKNENDDGMTMMDFEFPLVFRNTQRYMSSLYLKVGSGGKVWFNGRIDKKTEKVIAAYIGKISERSAAAAINQTGENDHSRNNERIHYINSN